jgi:hypothetical protein
MIQVLTVLKLHTAHNREGFALWGKVIEWIIGKQEFSP